MVINLVMNAWKIKGDMYMYVCHMCMIAFMGGVGCATMAARGVAVKST